MSFIVIEGLDGSGKSTQLKKLKEFLTSKNISFKYLHFPQTDKGVFGPLVARFLRGDLGKNNQVDPYLVGLIYAGDREYAKKEINQWIKNGELVIVDRYVYSNMAFQGAKLTKPSEKEELRKWLKHLEYNYYGIPEPELSIFLDVPFDFTQKSLSDNRQGDDRDYLNGKEDIHEADLSFQEKVRQEYLALIKTDERFKRIKCYNDNDNMLLPEQIFDKIIGLLQKNEILKHE